MKQCSFDHYVCSTCVKNTVMKAKTKTGQKVLAIFSLVLIGFHSIGRPNGRKLETQRANSRQTSDAEAPNTIDF
jgi:hypothetical protein